MKQNKFGDSPVKAIHIILAIAIIIVAVVGGVVANSINHIKTNSSNAVKTADKATGETSVLETAVSEEEEETESVTKRETSLQYPKVADDVKELDDSLILSQYAVLVDLTDNKIIAERDPDTRLFPASMTKIMTLIVAMEHQSDMDMEFTMQKNIIDPLKMEGAAMAGFEADEKVTFRDLLYGCGLSSGSEATTSLAVIIAGSEDDFVKLMNDKVKELGLKDTHFANCTGLHDEENYTTATDMALIMEYAMQNKDLKKILSTYQYTTNATNKHPNGLELESTMFSKMVGDEVKGIKIIAGKTGFTDEAGRCLCTYAEGDDGNKYICVAADSQGVKGAIYDTLNIYGTINNGYHNPTTTAPPETGTTTITSAVNQQAQTNAAQTVAPDAQGDQQAAQDGEQNAGDQGGAGDAAQQNAGAGNSAG